MEKVFTCIVCPRGCRITVDENLNITGNMCKRGIDYVLTELNAPKRIVTSTVRTSFSSAPRISVKTDSPIPKQSIYKIMEIINTVVVDKEVSIGDKIIENILDTGANIVATKSIKKE